MRGMRAAVIFGILAVTGRVAHAADPATAVDRGRQALTGQSFISPEWPLSAYAKAGDFWGAAHSDPGVDPSEYAKAFNARYGLHPAPYPNNGLPMGLRQATSRDGKRTGLNVDCMMCHGGSIGGTSYVGLGNTQLDSITLLTEMARAAGHFPPIAPFVLNTARGTVNAGQMSVFLLSLRNTDLSRRFVPLATGANLPELDVPAWWVLAKKSTQYYDGRTDARSARPNMQFMLGEKTLQEFQALEPTFQDVMAFIRSIEPPKYPFPIDLEKSRRGESLFAENCAKCHGTYGADPTYPNEVVALDVIGTDPARVLGITDKFLAHYNATWFAGEGKVDETLVGYQAPPLDGIWATAPYLHNGSIPTLEHLLNSKVRPGRFLRPVSTSFEHYDTQKVGWRADPAPSADDPAVKVELKRVFDTSRWGLGNAGHTFGDRLSNQQRADLIEYLKTL